MEQQENKPPAAQPDDSSSEPDIEDDLPELGPEEGGTSSDGEDDQGDAGQDGEEARGEGEKKQKKSRLQKRQERYQRLREQLLQRRKEEKAKQKEKKRQLQQQQQQQSSDAPQEPQAQYQAVAGEPLKRKKKDIYIELMQTASRVVVDLQFLDLLRGNEVTSMLKQLSFCHSANSRARNPVKLTITSLRGAFRNRLLSEQNAHNWGIDLQENDVDKLYPKEDLVYLTGDAQEDMEEYDKSKIYIIGGLVDHNRLKNTTYDWAKKNGIKTLRFPIKKYIDIKGSMILIINHVFDIMLEMYNGGNWADTFIKCIPQRKGTVLKKIDQGGAVQGQQVQDAVEESKAEEKGDA